MTAGNGCRGVGVMRLILPVIIVAAVAVLTLPLGGCITTDNASATPDNPYPANYKALVKAAKSDLFIDPDSVRDAAISAPKLAAGPIPSNKNNALSKWVTPWIVCVKANARNRMGGYTGRTLSAILIYDGQIFSTRSGSAQIWRVRLMNWWYDAKSNDFECIARSSDAESAKSGMTYSPVLKGYEPPRGTVYCVD
jgi:hypothetical protein